MIRVEFLLFEDEMGEGKGKKRKEGPGRHVFLSVRFLFHKGRRGGKRGGGERKKKKKGGGERG